jgi:hypothetical protein
MKKLLPVAALVLAVSFLPSRAMAAIINVDSDGTWRATSPAPAAGWNTSGTFDDSDAAGWEYAFKSPQGAKIWIRSNQSSEAPNQAWFRKVFTLPAKPISASAVFIFDDDGEAYLNGTLVLTDPGGGATTFNVQLDTNLFVAGENLMAVHGIDTHAPFNNISVEMILDVPLETPLIAAGSVWKYLDDGSDQGSPWRSVSFNDSSWSSGPAQLGYGDGDEATTNSFGADASNKYVTTYYRHSFTLMDALAFTNLQLRLLRDDGAIVYFNGVEVFRSNLPTGAVSYVTFAQSSVADDGTFWIPVDLPARALRNGTNVVAVEVHQNAGNSSDLSFDLALVANFPRVPALVTMGHWPALLGGNDHFYESVAGAVDFSWNSANALATVAGGYLATVTSAAENATVFQLIKDRPELWTRRPSGDSWGPWLGGLQPAGSTEPGGGWSWVTGEPFSYTHWAPGEPSNTQPGEDRVHYIGKLSSVGDTWNDKASLDLGVAGFIAEYEQRLDPAPILELKFDETGFDAPSTGLNTNAARLLVDAAVSRDLHSANGKGVSGRPGDRAFDNSISSGMGNKGDGGRATIVADVDAADDLLSLTLQGWFRAEGAGITDLARLITKQAGNTGFLLLGTGGNLDLEINNVGTTSTGARYADAGEWVFFAVTYDGTATSGNVRFYRGSRNNIVILLETRTLNQGRALANSESITVGNSNGTFTRPFDGWLDNVRVFGSKLNSSGALTLRQLEWLRNKDVQNLSEPVALSVIHTGSFVTLQWPAYPGGFHLESSPRLDGAFSWNIVTNAAQSDGNRYSVSVEVSAPSTFFRLAR